MELYVLTYIENNQWEGNIEELVGVYDELNKVVDVANEKGYAKFVEEEGLSWDRFLKPSSNPNYLQEEFLLLQRVTLNETIEEDEAE